MGKIISNGIGIALCSTLLTAAPASAHFYAEPAACRPPAKPLKFVTELDAHQFNQKVSEYRTCLENFVSKQTEAMETHKASAEKAAAVWRTFVEQELGQQVQPTEENETQPGGTTADSAASPASAN